MSRRRHVLKSLVAMFTAGWAANAKAAEEAPHETEVRFPGDPTQHNVVFQLNKADAEYHMHILFSVSELLRRYGDNITIVVVAFGPGIHILAKQPAREVTDEVRQKVSSLASYGVQFHACGNTMHSLGWTDKDMLKFAEVVKVGAADIMELQEQGYSYLSW